ncbi:MAG: Fe-S cluster assembly ATPase SufC [Clostridia bacterium]|nr:Fe-S cluster assembly ATPase SufC [Clostridia bacterium]
MSTPLLSVHHIDVAVENKRILHDISLDIAPGETHVLMGPNGAGKSTLGYALMGSPRYTISGGDILFKNEDITEETPDKRAKRGMFLSFQEPLEVPGLSLESFLRSAISERTGEKIRPWEFCKQMKKVMELLEISPEKAERGLNVGFSGGEKKKAEILQMLLFRPDLAILDETDSGLDVDAVRLVAEGIRTYQQETGGALLIITHSTRILEPLHIDRTHIMVDGALVYQGDGSLVDRINREGYDEFISMKRA